MVTLTSRILTIGLALYSFLQVRAITPQNVPPAPAGIAAQVLFAVQLLTGILFSLIPYFPESVHFGSHRLADFSREQLERIQPLLLEMLALMGVFFALYFAVNIHLLIRQALSSSPRDAAHAIVAIMPWLTGGLVVSETAIIFCYLRRFDAASNSKTTDN
ncbi:MAG: hypothetical protein WA197_10595 [Candidatus Acidiferrales bacterium]